jgi:acetyl esterase/lipase
MTNPYPPSLEDHYAIADQPPPADTTHIRRKFLNERYAQQSPAQALDIYLPETGDGPFPVILAIHGGAFMGCDKADLQVAPMLGGLQRGYAVVSINYRLSGEAQFPALVHDAKAAVRWLRAHAERFKLDPTRIAAWGGSAGGYQSLMLGVSAGVPELEDLSMGCAEQPSHVQAVVDWFSPVNFGTMDAQLEKNGLLAAVGMRHNEPDSPEAILLGGPITSLPERVRQANPETYLHADMPPFLIQHGDLDPIIPVQQSIDLAARLASLLGPANVTFEIIPGAAHGDPLFETEENVNRVLDFLDERLGRMG